MSKKLLFFIGSRFNLFCVAYSERLQENRETNISQPEPTPMDLASILNTTVMYLQITPISGEQVKQILTEQAPTLSPSVINKVVTTVTCANAYHVDHNHILTIIDYSLPSSEKRLWVIDLQAKKLLFNTYVSTDLTLVLIDSIFFNIKITVKQPAWVYIRQKNHILDVNGISLQLQGLDNGFNDNAASRAVVMHGGWYVKSVL